MGLFHKAPEENKFITLLIAQARKTLEGIRFLEGAVAHPDDAAVARLKVIETEADEVRRILIDELHNTFITPIDREDLFDLSLHLDDMIDYSLTTLEEMTLLEVDVDDYLAKMIRLVREEAEELLLATERLSANPRVAGDHARRAKKLENDVEHVYRQAVAALFAKATDVSILPQLFYRREVYRHVSNMSDRADTAANVFGMVVMKLS
jgi:uncharacterized protein Yka (UPF0111/DUF47 family)